MGDLGSNPGLGRFLVAQMVNNLPAVWETGFHPWVEKIPWRRKWQHTPVLLPGENSLDRGVWRATVHKVTKSRTWLVTNTHTHLEPNLAQNNHWINYFLFSYFEENGVHLKEKVVFKIKERERRLLLKPNSDEIENSKEYSLKH